MRNRVMTRAGSGPSGSSFGPSTPITYSRGFAAFAASQLEEREAAGLPPRKFAYKVVKNTEVMLKPEQCEITDTRTERGFVYFNLNGGDSWAYYHPEDRPDVIYNFKGEPNYLTKDLLPEYWASLTSAASRTSSAGVTYLVFLDRRTSTYYRGTYNAATDALDLTPAKNETQVRHFAEQHGVPLGSYIPEWDMTFDPHDNVRVDFGNRTVNTFQLTEYMKTPAKRVTKPPPTILRIIHHALGSDVACTEHFVNWLAFILQNRTRTLTAWVLHGVEGTGKGIMMNRILRPIFGKEQTAMRRMEELNEPYNSYMKRCFLVFIDEVESKALMNEKGVMAKLRTFITEWRPVDLALFLRSPIDLNVTPVRNPTFVTLSDGSIRNGYTLKILNKRHDLRSFAITTDAGEVRAGSLEISYRSAHAARDVSDLARNVPKCPTERSFALPSFTSVYRS